MKKHYLQPTLTVVNIEAQNNLLEGSVTGVTGGTVYTTTKATGSALSRGSSAWDDDDED